jgi:NADH-quinone oxidoreductase subunit K
MHAVIPYLVAALLFGLGGYGVLRRRNAILVLMAVELMLNAVNLIFVTADATVRSQLVGVQIEAWARPQGPPHAGGVFALFVIVLAAAEVGVGLAIVLQFYRLRASVAMTDVSLDPVVESPPAGTAAAAGDPAPEDGSAEAGAGSVEAGRVSG